MAVGQETRWNAWKGWRAFFNWRLRRHGVPSPVAAMDPPRKPPRLPRALHWHEVERIMLSCYTFRQRTLVGLIMDTGVRCGEIAGLQLADLGDTTLRVTGKTGPRLVPISPHIRDRLRQILPIRPDRRSIYESLSPVMRRAGVDAGGPHRLRHTFAVHYLLNGGDVFTLQRILGHADISTTRIYAQMADRDVAAQHAKYSPAQALYSAEIDLLDGVAKAK